MTNKEYIQSLKNELENWSISSEDPYLDHIMFLPNILETLSTLYHSDLVKNDGATKNKIKHALDYIESGFDLISEELVGPAGYIDDAFISAHILMDIRNHDKHLKSIIESLIDIEKLQNIINDGKKMLGQRIYLMALKIINTV